MNLVSICVIESDPSHRAIFIHKVGMCGTKLQMVIIHWRDGFIHLAVGHVLLDNSRSIAQGQWHTIANNTFRAVRFKLLIAESWCCRQEQRRRMLSIEAHGTLYSIFLIYWILTNFTNVFCAFALLFSAGILQFVHHQEEGWTCVFWMQKVLICSRTRHRFRMSHRTTTFASFLSKCNSFLGMQFFRFFLSSRLSAAIYPIPRECWNWKCVCDWMKVTSIHVFM